MIKFNAKSNLVKTLILVMVSALMLSTSTYAWFSAGGAVSVDSIIAQFEGVTSDSTLVVEEAVDANFNGQRDPEESYAALSSDNILIPDMQPGKMNFYKMGVLTSSGVSASLVLTDITVTSDGTLTDEEILSNIKVVVNGGSDPNAPDNLWDYIVVKESPYSVTLASGITNTNIYLDIGIEGAIEAGGDLVSNPIHNTVGFQGAALSCSVSLQTQSAT